MEYHASFLLMHKILRDFHGDLDAAGKAIEGQIIPLQLRFVNYGTLFDDSGWVQILHELLGENFIGFPAGSMAEVIPMHGKSPIVIMTCLALKSLQT